MPELARAEMRSTRRVWIGYLDDALANKAALFGWLSGSTIERKIMGKWYRDGFIMPAFKAGDELRIK